MPIRPRPARYTTGTPRPSVVVSMRSILGRPPASLLPVRVVMQGRIRGPFGPLKTGEETGFGEDPVHPSTPDLPQSPKPPPKSRDHRSGSEWWDQRGRCGSRRSGEDVGRRRSPGSPVGSGGVTAIVLASASPARLAVLRAAGLEPQ